MLSGRGLIACGAWLLFMGAAPLLSYRLSRGKVGRRGEQFSNTIEQPLRHARLLAPQAFYQAIWMPLCFVSLIAGAILIAVGLVA
jgi:hypothetical protein